MSGDNSCYRSLLGRTRAQSTTASVDNLLCITLVGIFDSSMMTYTEHIGVLIYRRSDDVWDGLIIIIFNF